jgi:sugar lactone lactonase YvrE
MVVDGNGRAYVGLRSHAPPRSAPSGAPPALDSVIMVEPDGRIRIVADMLSGPNGSVISPDGRMFILAESAGQRITTFVVEADGSLSGRSLFAQLKTVPDGICLNADGDIWVSAVLDGEFLLIRRGGEILDRVRAQCGNWAVACVLGGDDRRTLFMITAEQSFENLSRLVDFRSDLSSTSKGFVETIQVAVPGAGWP